MGVLEGLTSLITASSPLKEVKISIINIQNMFFYIYVSAAFPNNVRKSHVSALNKSSRTEVASACGSNHSNSKLLERSVQFGT